MKNRSKHLIIASGFAAAAAAVIAVSYNTTKALVSAALDREAPKIMSKKKPHSSPIEKGSQIYFELKNASDKLLNTNCETIEINSHDNYPLIGHWHKCENAKRIIVAMHGWRSSWTKDFGAISDFWYDNNCSVLYAEQRGQNNSGGDYMGFGMIERYDCAEWVKWVNQHNPDNLPIYLAGISMGASTVLMTAGFRLPQNVHGIMADCGFTSANAIWKHVTENNMHMSYNFRKKMVNDLCKKKIQVGYEDYTTFDALAHNEIPVLFIHGTDDKFVPIEMTYQNYKACTAPKRLFVVPGAGHAMSYIVDK
ncbi:MAG: alpha/beta hydrolase, partial [Clostridia bacterium]|nr:alpha/beta hydrolase [Clostridia bacterium]